LDNLFLLLVYLNLLLLDHRAEFLNESNNRFWALVVYLDGLFA